MSAEHPYTLLKGRPSIDAALRGIDSSEARAREVLDGLVGLARQDGALALRLAMVLAWVKRQDPSALGYPSFTAFCRERVGWADSWMRDLVRLVESPLDLVKAAVCHDLVPLRVAVKAPGRVRVEDQAEWLLDPRVDAVAPRPLDRFHGDDAEVIHRARRLARLCLGRPVSVHTIDEYIVRCWKDGVAGETILAAARQVPEKPAWEALGWDWASDAAPAEALLGPWVAPCSVAEAVGQIEAIEAIRRGRSAALARMWAIADHHALWTLAGFDSGWDFAVEVLGWSRRTTQRHRRVGWALEWYPALDEAASEGLDLGAVAILAGVVSPHSVDRWVAVARRVGRLELTHAIDAARTDSNVLARYEALIEVADRMAPSAGGPAPDATGAPSAGGPVSVALPHRESEVPPGEVRGPRGLAEAARWFVDVVRVEPARGFGKVKERDGYRCQNPECGRVSLRNEAHHIWPRSEGGSDEPENGVTVCRPCHLRGIHTADSRITVERVTVRPGVEALLWRFAGGRAVLALR